MKKQEIQNALNNFSGDFREIFIENSDFITGGFINWNLKNINVNNTAWVSILSRTWSDEYFKVVSGDDYNLLKETQNFKNQYNLNNKIKNVELNWEYELVLEANENLEKTVEIIKNVLKIFENVIKKSNFIVASEAAINLSIKRFIIANTLWSFDKDELYYNSIFLKLIWEKSGAKEEIFRKITWINILEDLSEEKLEKLFIDTVKNLEAQLEGIPAESWEMDVIIWNESGWTIIHEAIWHGLEWDLQGSSVYAWKIWEKVASDNVTIVDDPCIANLRGYYTVDHEGIPAKKITLIENWVLKTYMHNLKTAEKFDVEPTGHARRETYKHKTLVRMWTTYLAPWKDKKEDLITKIKDGLYVSEMWWGQVNTVTWDFVFKVQSGYKIKDWKLAQRVRWATLSWNWPEMLNNVFGICDDLEFFDWGTCGKWQAMPVSDWTATLWTKLKVSWLN